MRQWEGVEGPYEDTKYVTEAAKQDRNNEIGFDFSDFALCGGEARSLSGGCAAALVTTYGRQT